MIPVRFVVEMNRTKIDPVKSELKDSGIFMVRAGEYRLIEAVSAVLVGHVLHSDPGNTTNCIDSTSFTEVMDVSLTITGSGVDEPSFVYFSRPILALI